MISVCGTRVAAIDGWRGDRLFLGAADEPFELVEELGWDDRKQITPQRRVLLTERACFVIEPEDGLLLKPPYRVRRFARGREAGREVGVDVEGADADLVFVAEREGDDLWRVWRGGVDPKSGRPVGHEGTVAAEFTGKESRVVCSGTPVRIGETWWYPVNNGGLVEDGPPGARRHPGDAAAAVVIDGRIVCPLARRRKPGVWWGDRWHRVPGPALYQHSRGPVAPSVVADGDGLVFLHRGGGTLSRLGPGPEATLPPGVYSALVRVGDAAFAFSPGDPPSLVALTGAKTPLP